MQPEDFEKTIHGGIIYQGRKSGAASGTDETWCGRGEGSGGTATWNKLGLMAALCFLQML